MTLKFYTDTHIPKQVAIQLRAKGIEVVRCEDVDMAEADDEAHLEYAANNGFVLITKDEGFRARHFRWISEEKPHKGIFYCGERQTAAIGEIVSACTTYYEIIESGAGEVTEIENEFFDICQETIMEKIINHIEIRDGCAYIRGTNKKAEMVARMYVGTDYSIEEVMEQYSLSAANVHAAITYYYDNREELDARHEAIVNEIRENAMTLEKFRAKIAAQQKDTE